jgi:hypothetical protein
VVCKETSLSPAEPWDKSISIAPRSATSIMLEVLDFIAEKGGDPKKVRESQRLRNAPEAAVDEVIELWQDARKSQYRWGYAVPSLTGC